MNPAHAASTFSVGSNDTLRDREIDGATVSVRDKLIEFYRRHYSANLMTLAIVGNNSLDELEMWAREFFSAVPNHNAPKPHFAPDFFANDTPTRLNLIPQQDHLRASFLFAVPSMEKHYRSKPLGYIANLLGHEGEGSLLAVLKELGWAQGLSAGAAYMDDVQGVFEISIRLTDAGLNRIDEIGALLFAAIKQIERHGIQAWR